MECELSVLQLVNLKSLCLQNFMQINVSNITKFDIPEVLEINDPSVCHCLCGFDRLFEQP